MAEQGAGGADLLSAEPAGVPHLRQVLAAAAVAAGHALDAPAPGAAQAAQAAGGREDAGEGAPARAQAGHVLTDAQARRIARTWGIDDPDERDPAHGGGVVVVLVDGLGRHQLEDRKGHAPLLRGWLTDAANTTSATGYGTAVTCLPSTTAAALTTFGTGAAPGTTGMVGYCVRRPGTRRGDPARVSAADNLGLISWEDPGLDPRQWQDVRTVFERLSPDPTPTRSTRGPSAPRAVSIGPARFAGSGLTVAALRGARHMAADRMEDRAGAAAAALRRGTGLVYLYVGELDHAGHAHGWTSGRWLAELERLDACLRELMRRVPAGTRVVLTADHGMIDTDERHHVILTDHPPLMADVVAVAGEPRFTHLYVRGGSHETAQTVARTYREVLGQRAAWVGTRSEAAALLGELSPRAAEVVGDVVVAMAGSYVLLDPRVHAPAAMAMPGVHGSVTAAEREVPLLLARA